MLHLWSIVATIICAFIERLNNMWPPITPTLSGQRQPAELPAEAFTSWWDHRSTDYIHGMALLDQIQAALNRICTKRATSPTELTPLIADLTVPVGKPWAFEPHVLRTLHQHLIQVHETLAGSPLAAAPDRWHRQGVTAAQGLHCVDGARTEVERRFGPQSWIGFTTIA